MSVLARRGSLCGPHRELLGGGDCANAEINSGVDAPMCIAKTKLDGAYRLERNPAISANENRTNQKPIFRYRDGNGRPEW